MLKQKGMCIAAIISREIKYANEETVQVTYWKYLDFYKDTGTVFQVHFTEQS